MPLPFRLRDNRKLFISEALSKGIPPQDIADYCGTSIEQISKTYGRSDDQSLLKLAILSLSSFAINLTFPESAVIAW